MTDKNKVLGVALAAVMALTTSAYSNVDERYAELQMVPEAINDPDPLMRLAQLEAIIAEGDATKVQLAIRTAFTVDDPNIRSLALRAHFASYKTVIIEASYPDELTRALESGSSDRKYQATASVLDAYGGQFKILTDYDNLSQIEMGFISLNNNSDGSERYSGSGNIRGQSITFIGNFRYTGSSVVCSFNISDYEGFVVSGVGGCDLNGGSVPFPVKIRLF